MKTIGVLGGLGPESTASFYCQLTQRYHALRGDYNYPETVILSLPMSPYIECGYRRADEVAEAIRRLAGAGADFAVAPCNSVHVVHEEVAADAAIPWVSIMEATAERVVARGLRRVGLLGTRFTIRADFYPRALAKQGIDVVLPDADDTERVNDIIYRELVPGRVEEASRRAVLEMVDRLKAAGAEGVVLGCTELPFLIGEQHTRLPVFDTTALLARKALLLALEEA